MEISRQYIERLLRDGRGGGSSYGGSGSGSGGGSSSSAEYAAEAGHAQRADHANTADSATNADHATSAADLDNDSPVYNKFLRKDTADEASGLIGFLQGLWVGTREADPEHEGETILTKTIEAFTNGLLKVKSFIINDLFGITSDGDATLRDITGRNATMSGSVQAAQLIANLLKTPDFAAAVGMIGKGFGVTTDNNGRATLQTDDLLVLGRMIVNTLNIREVSYIGGTYILTPAASTVEAVMPLYSDTPTDTRTWSTEGSGTPVGYRLLWVADDGTTGTMNFWEQGDQAFCQTFNLTEPGEYQNVSNHYWWRLVCRKGTVTIDGKDYHYADVANTQLVYLWDSQGVQITTPDGATSFAGMGSGNYTDPESGDKAVMLGSQRYTNRQGAVQLTAEGDASIGIYDGINNYANLTTHEIHFFSKNAVRMSSLRFMWTTADGESIPPTVYRGEWAIDPVSGLAPISSWGDEWTYQGNRWTCIIPNGGTTDEAPGTTPANWQASDTQQGPAGDSYQHVTVFRDGVDRPDKPVSTVYPPVPDGWAIAPIVQQTTVSFDNAVEIETGGEYPETFIGKYDSEVPIDTSYVRTRVEVESNGGVNSLTIRLMASQSRPLTEEFYITKLGKTFEDCYDGDTWDSSNIYTTWSTSATGVTVQNINIANIPEGHHFFDIVAYLPHSNQNIILGWKPGGNSGGVYVENSGNPRVYCSMATFVNGVIDANGWSDVTRWSGVDGASGAKGDKGDKGDTGEQGPAGENAALYELDPTANTIVYKNGVYTPQVLSASYTATRDGQPTGETDLVMKVSLDGGAEQSYNGGNLTPGGTGATGFQTSCRFLLYKGSLLVDSESVPVLKDGVDGLGSFVMDLTNEMSSINVDGTYYHPTSEQTVQTGVRLYYGTTPISNPTITLWDGATQITGSYANGIKYTSAGMNFTIWFSTAATVVGKKEITIRATFTHSGSQQEIEKVLTVNGFTPGAEGPAGPAGSDGFTIVAVPNNVVINQDMDDTSATPTYFNLPQDINFVVKQGNVTKSFTLTSYSFVWNDGQTTMGVVSRLTPTGGAQYLRITSLSSTTRIQKQTQGYVAVTVTPDGGSAVVLKIPVIVNYMGSIQTTIAGDVETTIAHKLTSSFTPEQDVTTIEQFGTFVHSSGQMLSSLQTQVDGYTTDISTLQQTSKLISMEVTGASGNLFSNPTFERKGSGTGSYVPAEWVAGSTATVSSSATRINGALPVTNNAGTFYQVVWGSLQTDRKLTSGAYHTITFFVKGSSSGTMRVRSSSMIDSNVAVTLDGVTQGTTSSLNVSVSVTNSWVRHTITFKAISSLSTTSHYISFDYYNVTFQMHSPRLVSLKTGGIDVSAGVVDVTADNFSVKNSAGEQTLGLDAQGNLALSGTVYARNLYHNVQVTGYSTSGSYSENITMADMVIIAMPAPSGSARFYLTLKLPAPSDYPGKVITLIGANPASDYIYIYLQYGSNTDIHTIWGTTGIGSNANLKYMHEIVVISYNHNGNYEWRVCKWTEADANGYNTLHDVLKGYV